MPITATSGSTSMFIAQAMRSAAQSAELSQKRLASGSRITSAADDPAGVAQMTYFNTRASGLGQAVRNGQSALAITSLADNTLTSLSDVMSRVVELVTAAAGSSSTAEKKSYADEYTSLIGELDRAASLTKAPDGTKLLDGSISSTGLSFMVGPDGAASDYITFKLDSIKSTDLGSATVKLSAINLNTINALTANSYITAAQTASSQLATINAAAGTTTRILNSRIGTLQSQYAATASAAETINGIDQAAETSNLSKQQIVAETAAAMLAQVNSNRSNLMRTLLSGI